MSYGIEFKNHYGERVLDETTEVMVVTEKGTISGKRSSVFGQPGESVNDDSGGQWIRRTHNGTPSGRTVGYFCTVVLGQTYAQKPSLALRGVNGTTVILPIGRVYKHSSTSFTSIRFTSKHPVNIEWILTSPSSLAVPGAIAVPPGEDYGVEVFDDSPTPKKVFDSRWPNLYAVRDVLEFPEFAGNNYKTNGVPSTTVTIKECPGAFFSTDGLYGRHSVTEEILQEEGLGASLLLLHGGEFYPSLSQVDDTTVKLTMRAAEEGNSQSATNGGNVNIIQPTGGLSYVIRFLNF